MSRKNAMIDCQAEGIPSPTHQWKKSSGGLSGELLAIVSGPHIHVLENGSLAIIDAEKEDEGDYVCEA
jgi:hypothetical protein